MKIVFFLFFTILQFQEVKQTKRQADYLAQPRYLYDKIQDEMSQKLTKFINDRQLKYPKTKLMKNKEVDIFKTINVHRFNPPYGILKKGKKFQILRYHKDQDPESKLSIKPVLGDRYAPRKEIPTQMDCLLTAMPGDLELYMIRGVAMLKVILTSNCKNYDFVLYFYANGPSQYMKTVKLQIGNSMVILEFSGKQKRLNSLKTNQKDNRKLYRYPSRVKKINLKTFRVSQQYMSESIDVKGWYFEKSRKSFQQKEQEEEPEKQNRWSDFKSCNKDTVILFQAFSQGYFGYQKIQSIWDGQNPKLCAFENMRKTVMLCTI